MDELTEVESWEEDRDEETHGDMSSSELLRLVRSSFEVIESDSSDIEIDDNVDFFFRVFWLELDFKLNDGPEDERFKSGGWEEVEVSDVAETGTDSLDSEKQGYSVIT